MSTPNDAAQPVAKIRVAGGDRSTVMWITDSPPTTPILVYTATDYDKLREEVERLRSRCNDLHNELCDAERDRENEYSRAEAAEARVAKLVERINERFESYYKQGPDHALDGEPLIYAAFLEELHETINAQGESNG